ncbi:hypothetical protein Bmyc01_03360 [Bacillus mycoides]|nr:hypothetical protein Bmyc01_03360 [Bacillus mycoides]
MMLGSEVSSTGIGGLVGSGLSVYLTHAVFRIRPFCGSLVTCTMKRTITDSPGLTVSIRIPIAGLLPGRNTPFTVTES